MVDQRLEQALTRVRAWGEAREWAGYDPYDALNSPLSDVLSLRTALGRRFLTQAVKLSPINLRPPLLIRPRGTRWRLRQLRLVTCASGPRSATKALAPQLSTGSTGS